MGANFNKVLKIVEQLAELDKEEALKIISQVKEILEAKPEDAEYIEEKTWPEA